MGFLNLKNFYLVFFISLLFFNVFVSAEVSLEKLSDINDGLNDRLDEAKSYEDLEKWDYLSQQWKSFLLKSQTFSQIDSFLKKLNPVFVIFFGQGYDLSLTFVFSIAWFVLFLFFFMPIIRETNPFSNLVGDFISLGLTIILAQIGVFRVFSIATFKILFYKDGPWSYVLTFLFFLVYFLFIASFNRLVRIVSIHIRKMKADAKDLEVESNKDLIIGFGKTLRKGLGGK